MEHDQDLGIGDFGMGLLPGDPHYRAYVGPPQLYDLVGAMQFNLLTHLGLREYHSLLDIGCGSLRFARLAIPYLRPGRYYGLEPNRWLIEEGIEHECGRDLIRIKRPHFAHNAEFRLNEFGVTFDYLLAQSIFSHAARPQIDQCLAEAASCMHRDSQLLATYVPGEVNYQGEDWVYPACCTYTEATMTGLGKDHGLICTPLQWNHPSGQLWLRFRKRPCNGDPLRDGRSGPQVR